MEQIILNLVPGGVSPVCYVSQYDVGRKIRLHLRNGSDPYVLSGAETVTATIRKVSGEELIYDIANTSASYVDLIVNYDATDVIGESVCELIITESSIRLGSANFKMRIDPDVYSGDQKLEVVSATSETPDLSFETNVEENLLELKAGFSPVQDLHGYDSPWIDSNVVNKKPYLLRAIAGTASRIGTHEYNKIVGGTVAFNQLCPIPTNSNTQTLNSVTMTDNRDGSYTFSGTASADCIFQVMGQKTWQAHKYVLKGSAKGGSTASYSLAMRGAGRDCFDFGNGNIWDATSNTWKGIVIYVKNGQNVDGLIFKPNIIDLTAMFGSTIADYIYSLEQATAGAGVAWFKALFPNDYYAYNAGELISVKTSAHVTKDANNNVISNIALDPDIELRGIPKLDENNNLYYDGDTYESNGGVTRRLSSVTLDSNLNPNNLGVTVLDNYTQVSYLPYMNIGVGIHSPFLCDKHFIHTQAPSAERKEGDIYNSGVETAPRMFFALPKTVTTAAEALTWFTNNPTTVLFYIATPTTESADPFTDPQEIDASGSEEFIDARAVSIPVGHESYYANICEIEGIDEITFYHSGEDTQDSESVTVEIGQDVYGGYYDKDLGIVLTKKTKIYDGSENWSLNTPSKPWLFSVPAPTDIKQGSASSLYVFSNMFDATSEIWSLSGYGILNNFNNILVGYPTAAGDVSILKSFLNKKSLTVCYQLETPIIIPADKVNLITVNGINNLMHDANGGTEVKFFRMISAS